jgi:hypothetical protein
MRTQQSCRLIRYGLVETSIIGKLYSYYFTHCAMVVDMQENKRLFSKYKKAGVDKLPELEKIVYIIVKFQAMKVSLGE